MKIAYINTVYGVKSTGRTYAELKEYLEKKGHQVKVFAGLGQFGEPNLYRIGGKFSYYFHNVMSRLSGLEGYFSRLATKKLVKRLKDYNPDVIHLGNLHGHYVNLPILFRYLNKAQKPVVITTHDCWSFTGKCSYFLYTNCGKWHTQCKNCSSKKKYPKSLFFDFSKKMYNDKKSWFNSLNNLTVVAVSNWMGEQVKESFLKEKNVKVNYNWIDVDKFKPLTKEERATLREELGYSDGDFIIITVSAHWKQGMPRFEDVNRLIPILKDNQKLLTVGLIQDNFVQSDRVKNLSFVSDVKYLAKLYGIADAFVHFSTADTFGKVIAEAQATGTPAIVYNQTACPEVATIGNGYIVDVRDVDDAYAKICELSRKSLEIVEKERQARAELVAKELSKNYRIEKLLEIYSQAVKVK